MSFLFHLCSKYSFLFYSVLSMYPLSVNLIYYVPSKQLSTMSYKFTYEIGDYDLKIWLKRGTGGVRSALLLPRRIYCYNGLIMVRYVMMELLCWRER